MTEIFRVISYVTIDCSIDAVDLISGEHVFQDRVTILAKLLNVIHRFLILPSTFFNKPRTFAQGSTGSLLLPRSSYASTSFACSLSTTHPGATPRTPV